MFVSLLVSGNVGKMVCDRMYNVWCEMMLVEMECLVVYVSR